MKGKIIKHIATIKEWNSISIELNLVKWGNAPEKYDIRKWENGEPMKGISIDVEDIFKLYQALGSELGYLNNHEESDDNMVNELPLTDLYAKKRLMPTPIDYRNFVIHDNFVECDLNGHQYDVINAIVPYYTNGKLVEKIIPARHCKTCKAYYISEFEYNKVCENGILICKVVSKKEYQKYLREREFGELSAQSELNSVGYNVGETKNLSDRQRQLILKCAIAEGIFTRQKAIGHIQFLIDLNEGKKNMQNALEKWHIDLKFLKEYEGNNNDSDLVGIRKIIQ